MKSMQKLKLTLNKEDDEIVYQKSRRFGKLNCLKPKILSNNCIRFLDTILPDINLHSGIFEVDLISSDELKGCTSMVF